MTREEMERIDPETFERLDRAAQLQVIQHHDENVREWSVQCPRCGFRMVGKLRELRGRPCDACGHGRH